MPDDIKFVPETPDVELVLEAMFNKDPDHENTTEKEKLGVAFFHQNIVAVLAPATKSDAMYGRSVMEVLDNIGEKKKSDAGDDGTDWELTPNYWAMTMATATMLLDKESGGSDCTSIVHNITKGEGEKMKRTKLFKKKTATVRSKLYQKYLAWFTEVWVMNKKNDPLNKERVARFAKWDLHTGMTKEVCISAAQKRSREHPLPPPLLDSNKKMKTGFSLAGMSSTNDDIAFDYIAMLDGRARATTTTNSQMPSLTSTPTSSSDSSVDHLQEAQNREVAGNPISV